MSMAFIGISVEIAHTVNITKTYGTALLSSILDN